MTWTLRMVMRRSTRSASAPAKSTKTSQGRRPAIETPAISAGDAVRVNAISGSATKKMPSARLAAAEDVHNLR